MRILLGGINGHMGREVAALLEKNYRGGELIAGVDIADDPAASVPVAHSFSEACADVDVIVDFSHHSGTAELLAFAKKNNLPLVLATTGQTEEEKQMIADAAKEIPVFFAANYSLGIALLIELAKKTAAVMTDAEIEIVEVHHDRKVDAPSGTAIAIAEELKNVRTDAVVKSGRTGYGKREPNEIGVQSVRIGNVVGIHEVMIGTNNQTITLKHEAHSRALFAEGALAAAEFMVGKPAGFYDMKSLVTL